MVDEYKDRFAWAMRRAGYRPEVRSDVKRLAGLLGVTPQAIQKIIDGLSGAMTAPNNSKAAAEMQVNANWLATGMGGPTDGIATLSLVPVAHDESQRALQTPLHSWEELKAMAQELPKLFRVVLRDAALAPELCAGDELTFERADDAPTDALVLLRTEAGDLIARYLSEGLPGQRTASAPNPAFRPLDLDGAGLKIVAVCIADRRTQRYKR